MRQNAVEAYIPSAFFPRNCGEILRVSDLAVCRVNLSQVDLVCQLGDSISEMQKLRVLVSGTSVSGQRLSLVLKIDSDGLITQEIVDFTV